MVMRRFKGLSSLAQGHTAHRLNQAAFPTPSCWVLSVFNASFWCLSPHQSTHSACLKPQKILQCYLKGFPNLIPSKLVCCVFFRAFLWEINLLANRLRADNQSTCYSRKFIYVVTEAPWSCTSPKSNDYNIEKFRQLVDLWERGTHLVWADF